MKIGEGGFINYIGIISLILILFIVSHEGIEAQARQSQSRVLDLHVREDLKVYAKAQEGSEVISTLGRGDRVVISPREYQGWRKVLVIHQGQRRAGYIKSADLRHSEVISRQKWLMRQTGRHILYKNQRALGFAFVPSYMMQAERRFSLANGVDEYSISQFDSFTAFVAIQGHIPIADHFSVAPYINLRRVEFEGSATLQGTGSLSSATTLKQDMIGLGAILRYYPNRDGLFWLGGGLEGAKVNKLSLQFGTAAAHTPQESTPTYVMLMAASGLDLKITQLSWLTSDSHLFLTPDLRAGAVVTTQPAIYFAEAYLGLAISF